MQHVKVKPLIVETGDCNSSDDDSSTTKAPQLPETGGTFEDVVPHQLNAKTHHQCNSSARTNNDKRISNHGALLSNLRIKIPPLQIYLPQTDD